MSKIISHLYSDEEIKKFEEMTDEELTKEIEIIQSERSLQGLAKKKKRETVSRKIDNLTKEEIEAYLTKLSTK